LSAASNVSGAIDALDTARTRILERSDEHIVGSLASVFERWRDPSSACRRELEAKLPGETGLTTETVLAGLELGLSSWTGKAFEDLIRQELELGSTEKPWRSQGYSRTSVVLAGSIPMPSLLSLLLPLAIRSTVLCKPASRDVITARLVADSVREVDSELGDCIAIVPFEKEDAAASELFFASPCVTATGSGETIREIEGKLARDQARLLYGHRISIGVIELKKRDESALGELTQELATDIALWDQLGCLSPTMFYLVGENDSRREAFCEALADALANKQALWPRGLIAKDVAADIARERSEAEMRSALGRPTHLLASSGTEWTIVVEDDCRLRPAPLHRFIRVMPARGFGDLLETLSPIAPVLAGVALDGFDSNRESVCDKLMQLGASRVCQPGRLQAPPLDWPRDNQPLLRGMLSPPEPTGNDSH